MDMNEAPFGSIGMKICPTTPQSRAFARGKGFRVPGGWGVGKKLKNVSFLGHFFLNFSKKDEQVERNRSNSLELPPTSLNFVRTVAQIV